MKNGRGLKGRIYIYPKSTYGGYFSRFYIIFEQTPDLPSHQKIMMKIQKVEFPTRLTVEGKQTWAPLPRTLAKRLGLREGDEIHAEISGQPGKSILSKAVRRKGANYFLDLKVAIPKQSYNGYKITINELQGGLLRVSYQTVTHAPKPIDLPRYLPLNSENFEVMGLAQGELLKCVRKGLLSFSNSDPALVNRFLDFCENAFGLKRIKWKASLVISRFSHSKYEKELKKFWSKNVGIPLKNFVKTQLHSYGQRVSRGTLHIYVSSVLLAWLMIKLLTIYAKLAISKTDWTAAFMRGVFAADGCPILRPSGVLLSADIAHNPKNVKHISMCRCFQNLVSMQKSSRHAPSKFVG